MCTVTLSFDPNNVLAQRSLAALLATGQFTTDEETMARYSIDYSDPWLYEDHDDLPLLPEGRDSFTLEEFRDMLMEDLRDVYGIKDEEVSVYH